MSESVNALLQAAKRQIASGEIDAAKLSLDKVFHMRKAWSKNERIEYGLVRSAIAVKEESWSECLDHAREVTLIDSSNMLAWRVQIRAALELGFTSTVQEVVFCALTKLKPPRPLLDDIAPLLKRIDDPVVTNLFLDAVPPRERAKFARFLPNTPELVESKKKMLNDPVNNDPVGKSEMVELLLYTGEIEQARQLLMELGDDPAGLKMRVFLGDDPYEDAKRYQRATKDFMFADFIEAVEKKSFSGVMRATGKFRAFPSALRYLYKQFPSYEHRSFVAEAMNRTGDLTEGMVCEWVERTGMSGDIEQALNILEKYQNLVTPEKERGLRVNLKLARGDVLNDDELVGVSLNETQKAATEWSRYQDDHDKARLRTILECSGVPEFATKALLELRAELSDTETEREFAKLLKQYPTSGDVLKAFAQFEMAIGHKDPAVMIYERYLESGHADYESCDLVSLKCIESQEYEKAINILNRVTGYPDLQFRNALLHQRVGRLATAMRLLQESLRHLPEEQKTKALAIIGDLGACLGKGDTLRSVARELSEAGFRDLDLDALAAVSAGLALPDVERQTPVTFYEQMREWTNKLRVLRPQGWHEHCLELVNRGNEFIAKYVDQFPGLASIMKACGDFAIEAYFVTQDNAYIEKARGYFMRRAEIDRQAESFIDVAMILDLMGQRQAAASTLRRVLTKFQGNSSLWAALGVEFALLGQYKQARHCLSVAYKLSSNNSAFLLACCCEVARLTEDPSFEKLLEAAKATNSHGPIEKVCYKCGIGDQARNLEAIRLSGSEIDLSACAGVYLREGKRMDALNCALGADDKKLISKICEARGMYDMAIHYAADEADKKRISAVVSGAGDDFPVLNLVHEGKFAEAAALLEQSDDGLSHVGAAICYAYAKDLNATKRHLMIAREKLPSMAAQLKRLSDIFVAPPTQKVPARVLFMKCLIGMPRERAVAETERRQKENDPFVQEMRLMEMLRTENPDPEALYKLACKCYEGEPSIKTLKLLVSACLKTNDLENVKRPLQKLLVLKPSLYPKMKNLMKRLS